MSEQCCGHRPHHPQLIGFCEVLLPERKLSSEEERTVEARYLAGAEGFLLRKRPVQLKRYGSELRSPKSSVGEMSREDLGVCLYLGQRRCSEGQRLSNRKL